MELRKFPAKLPKQNEANWRIWRRPKMGDFLNIRIVTRSDANTAFGRLERIAPVLILRSFARSRPTGASSPTSPLVNFLIFLAPPATPGTDASFAVAATAQAWSPVRAGLFSVFSVKPGRWGWARGVDGNSQGRPPSSYPPLPGLFSRKCARTLQSFGRLTCDFETTASASMTSTDAAKLLQIPPKSSFLSPTGRRP